MEIMLFELFFIPILSTWVGEFDARLTGDQEVSGSIPAVSRMFLCGD